ncbi:MAG TPA: HPr family phosphocarrier protein [Desulfobulbus sp.]|nr:HPr family phosphocarrier protein [Desulfobulbus sp.]HHD64586.1 HPr family phosphocarrier protein [Desulfobulbaceae bacterium]
MTVLQKEMKVGIHCGVHGRVAVKLAEIAEKNKVDMEIISEKEQVNCRSILEVLGLALVQGSHICVRAEGKQAAKALITVKSLLAGQKI